MAVCHGHGWPRRGLALLACAVCHGWSWTLSHRVPTRLPPSRLHLKAARDGSDSNSEFRRDRGSGGEAIDDSSARATVPSDATVDEGELSDAATGSTFGEDEWAYGDDRSLDREEWEVPLADGERLRDRPTETQPTRSTAAASAAANAAVPATTSKQPHHYQQPPPTTNNEQSINNPQPTTTATLSRLCARFGRMSVASAPKLT